MNIHKRTLAEINQEAITLLYKHLGPADAIRFMNQFTLGQGNYTEEREELFKGESLDDLIEGIEKMKLERMFGQL